MEQTNRSYEVKYHDPSLRGGTTDVTFALSKDGEDALFTAFENEVSAHLQEGNIPDQKVHLLERLCSQQSSHPPWIDARANKRVYDLELSEWDYHLLTKIIGRSLSSVLNPDGTDEQHELVNVWMEITNQMQRDEDEEVVADDPDNGKFMCYVRNGQFRLYQNESGDQWYVCEGCETSFKTIGDNHDCTKYQ